MKTIISCLIDDEINAALEKLAADTGGAKSDFIRLALDEYLSDRKRKLPVYLKRRDKAAK